MAEPKRNHHADEEPPDQDWFGWIDRIRKSFGRFSWDIGGIILIALSLMLLLAFTGLTSGRLLSFFSAQLRVWFGWGSFLFVIATALGGFFLLRKSKDPLSVKWGKVIAIEVAAFLLLALLPVISEPIGRVAGIPLNSLERAEAGMDGGLIGWGLANLFGRFVSPVLSVVLILVALTLTTIVALGLLPKIEAWLYRMAGEDIPSQAAPVEIPKTAVYEPSNDSVTEAVVPPSQKPSVKKAVPLEKKFRKAFKVSDAPDEKPAKPLPRGERLPPLNLLLGDQSVRPDEKTINQTAGMIEKTLSEFGIPAQVIGFRVGPSVTQFAVQPGFD